MRQTMNSFQTDVSNWITKTLIVALFLNILISLPPLSASGEKRKVSNQSKKTQDVTIRPKTTPYIFYNDPIDVVIPCTNKDLPSLNLCINGIRKNGKNIRRIIVVSANKLTDIAEWFNESLYPFSKYDVAYEIFGNKKQATLYQNTPGNRLGWIYQQLLKLYAPFVIPNISSNVLILDADTIFLNPVEFLGRNHAGLLNIGTEYHLPYFEHGARLLPGFRRLFREYSGVSHHMLFQKSVLKDLFKCIELANHDKPWRCFCHCIDRTFLFSSSASEYELYFNFSLSRTNQLQIRSLKWENISDITLLEQYRDAGYTYVSCHKYEIQNN